MSGILGLEDLSPDEFRKLQEIISHPLSFAENLLINYETGEQFKPFFTQRKIFETDSTVNWICIHRRGGKCVIGNTRILDPVTLRPRPIAESKSSTSTFTFQFSTNTTEQTHCEWVASGTKQCSKLHFGTGKQLGLSNDHELFVHGKGWTPTEMIRVGDKVLAPSSIPIFGSIEKSVAEINSAVAISLNERHIPDEVFLYTKTSLSQFLRLLWEQHGRTIPTYEALGIILYDESLALDIQHLLLRFGIESRVSEDRNIFIEDIIDQSVFLNLVGVDFPVYDVKAPRRWEIVIKVRKIGLQEVYDICVDHEDHNFLGEDVVVHNSHALSFLALYLAITQENKRIIFFTPSQPQIEEIFNEKIDGWIGANPVINSMVDHGGINRNNPTPVRSFKTGSTIQGFILGTKEGAQEGKRGLSADYLFLDEAQEYTKTDWAVVGAIMGGDRARRMKGGVKSWITGTIRQPDGYYFKKIKVENIDPKVESRTVINIEQNEDETPDSIAALKASQPPEIWNNEWMLELGDESDTIFPKDMVVKSFSLNWNYGAENVGYSPLHGYSDHYVRFIGVDWDRVGAGTNIAVVQYDPRDQFMWTIDRIEVPKGEFTYYDACQQIFELYDIYKPELVISDAGAGDMQWQYLYVEAGNRGMYDLQNRLLKLNFGSKIEFTNPQTGDPERVYVKPVLVGHLLKKFQESKIWFPQHDEPVRLQFLTYKKVRETINTVVYTSKNEHIIDAHLFAAYGIWALYEDPLMFDQSASSVLHNIGIEKTTFQDQEDRVLQWSSLGSERYSANAQRAPLGGGILDRDGDSSFLQQKSQFNRWLVD